MKKIFKINESNFKSIFNSSKVTDHYAIIPTISGIGKTKDLPEKESKIYNLIKDKLLASCSDNLKRNLVEKSDMNMTSLTLMQVARL